MALNHEFPGRLSFKRELRSVEKSKLSFRSPLPYSPPAKGDKWVWRRESKDFNISDLKLHWPGNQAKIEKQQTKFHFALSMNQIII